MRLFLGHDAQRARQLVGARGALAVAIDASQLRDDIVCAHARHERRYALGIAVATPDELHAANDIAVQFYVYRPRTRAAGGVCHLIHKIIIWWREDTIFNRNYLIAKVEHEIPYRR